MYCYIPLFVIGDLCDGGPESYIYFISAYY